jgi:CO/xanthine dehydrogenase Mo-binding subunit
MSVELRKMGEAARCRSAPNRAKLIFEQGQAFELAMGAVDMPFAIPNVRVENPEAEAHKRIGWFRSVSNIPHAFAVQSFAAELAAAAGRDPKEYLLELIGYDRLIDAAAMSDDGAGTGSRLQAATAA